MKKIAGTNDCAENRQNPLAETASMPFCKNTVSAGLALVESGSVISTPMDSKSAR